MDEDALQIYHDPKAHRDDLRAVIDSQEIEIARLLAELARAANSDPTVPLPPLPGIDGKPKTPNVELTGVPPTDATKGG
jgi:hypothetical protein